MHSHGRPIFARSQLTLTLRQPFCTCLFSLADPVPAFARPHQQLSGILCLSQPLMTCLAPGHPFCSGLSSLADPADAFSDLTGGWIEGSSAGLLPHAQISICVNVLI